MKPLSIWKFVITIFRSKGEITNVATLKVIESNKCKVSFFVHESNKISYLFYLLKDLFTFIDEKKFFFFKSEPPVILLNVAHN